MWFYQNRKTGPYSTTLPSICLTRCHPQGQIQNYSISHSPFFSCFRNNRASAFVIALNNYCSLPRNANLLQCPACPSGLPPTVSPFHVWQSISPRHPSTAACPQRHPGPGSSCLVRNVGRCFFSKYETAGWLKHKIQVKVPNLASELSLFNRHAR